MYTFVCLATFFVASKADIITNSVKGVPEVECMENKLKLSLLTEQPFTGQIFVKNKHYDEACVQKYKDNKQKGAYFLVQIGRCGMQKLRSASPKGMNFVIAVVISFHPQFITHVDRAYNIRCFYMEAEESVSSKLEVSMIPTSSLYDSMIMPKCKYAVKLNSLNGPEVFYANIGEIAYHVWECTGPDMGILVKKCFVKDGTGEEAAIVNNEGCSADQQLLSDLTYDSSLMKAYATSLVFKYADRNTLFFTCQIVLCQKQFGMCEGVSPPKCAKEYRLKKRSVNSSQVVSAYKNEISDHSVDDEHILDVLTQEMTIFDLQKQSANNKRNVSNSESFFDQQNSLLWLTKLDNAADHSRSLQLCASYTQVYALMIALLATFCLMAALMTILARKAFRMKDRSMMSASKSIDNSSIESGFMCIT